MSKNSGQSQGFSDQADIEIVEDNQVVQDDLAVIDKAEKEKIDRHVALKIAEKYLDGQEYDLARITAEVKVYFERMAQDYVAVGRRLLIVKQVEGHGKYMKWLEDNFPLSPRSARRFTKIAMAIEQRPDLAPLAKTGTNKALLLFDLPEEYLDEAEQEGTIDGKPLDEFQTMTLKEIIAENKRLKKDQEKIIAEETKGLKAENEDLINENKRLKKFEPVEETTPEWCLVQSQRINQTAVQIIALCREFLWDERMKDDIQMQAKIEGNIELARKALREFVFEWNDTFNPVVD